MKLYRFIDLNLVDVSQITVMTQTVEILNSLISELLILVPLQTDFMDHWTDASVCKRRQREETFQSQ